MNNKLTARYKKYLVIANSIEFNKEELKLLGDILESKWSNPDFNSPLFDVLFSIGDALRDCNKYGHCYETYNEDETEGAGVISDTRSVPLTFMQYLLINFKKVFFFITFVPLNQVPRYINDPYLAPFAKWRLTIAR
jgi:hypothetical protein